MISRVAFAVAAALLALTVVLPALGGELTDTELSERLEAFMATAEREGFSGAVLVARNHEILIEKGFGVANPATGAPVEADTVFTTGSTTKQFTAAAIKDA